MELLDLQQFKKAYPHLSKKMYKVLNIEYPENIKVPIDMEDAALADTFFAKYKIDKSIEFGRKKAKMIMDLVKSQPQMEKWLDILYPNFKEPNVKKKHIRKKRIIKDEIILYVYKTAAGCICKDKNGVDFTKEVNNRNKLQYAHCNDSVIRGYLFEGKTKYEWRNVKRKLIEKNNLTIEEIEQKLTNESNNKQEIQK